MGEGWEGRRRVLFRNLEWKGVEMQGKMERWGILRSLLERS